MGNFDAFVDDDDDVPVPPPPVFVPMQASVPAPMPTPLPVPLRAPAPMPVPVQVVHPPAPMQPAAPPPVALGMIDLLSACRTKSTEPQLHALKVTYMKLKERLCTVVDFLKAARDILGEDQLVQAMAASRVARQRKAAAQALAAQAEAEAARARAAANDDSAAGGRLNDKDGETRRDFRDGKDDASRGKESGSGSGGKDSSHQNHQKNLDVAQEADDVLAIAGVNADEEARYMFGDDGVDRADAYTDFTPKASWRKLIELRVFARVAGKDGIAARNGIPNVDDEKVYAYMEEALQARLTGLIREIQTKASRRNDPNRRAFGAAKISATEPKAAVRKINVDCEREHKARLELERQRLLRVGETYLSKRKRARGNAQDGDGDGNTELKEKVAKVQQEEEERLRAETANQAAQAALGSDAKYLKWAEAAKNPSSAAAASVGGNGAGTNTDANRSGEPDPADGTKTAPKIAGAASEKFPSGGASFASTEYSLVLKDCAEAIKYDVRGRALRSMLLGRF